MFSELMGYDEYDQQLYLWAYRHRLEKDRVRQWRLDNPEKARQSQRERNRRWRERFGSRKQKPRFDRKAYQRAYYEANRERLIAAAKDRQSKKAATGRQRKERTQPDPEMVREYRRRDNQRRLAAKREWAARWAAANPDKARERYRRANRSALAAKRKREWAAAHRARLKAQRAVSPVTNSSARKAA